MTQPPEIRQVCSKIVDTVASSRDWKLDIVASNSNIKGRESDRDQSHDGLKNDGRTKKIINLGALQKHFLNGKALGKKKADTDRCRLLELPPELRLIIYSYVFTIEKPCANQRSAIKFLTKKKPICISYDNNYTDQYLPTVWFIGQLTGGLALLRTCRQIYNESSKVWFKLKNEDKRAQIYHLLRPQKLTRCDKCPSRLPWNSRIRCDRCNDIWKDSVCKEHVQPVKIFFALAHCPACQWNAYASKRKLPWYAKCDQAKQLYVFKATGPKDLGYLLEDSYAYGDAGAKSKQFARIRVKYKTNPSNKEMYTHYYQFFLAWRSELLRTIRTNRG